MSSDLAVRAEHGTVNGEAHLRLPVSRWRTKVEEHPMQFLDGLDTWTLDTASDDFRFRLLTGDATLGWNGDEHMDLYFRDQGPHRLWSLWRFPGGSLAFKICVHRFQADTRPAAGVLRELEARRMTRYDWVSETAKVNKLLNEQHMQTVISAAHEMAGYARHARRS